MLQTSLLWEHILLLTQSWGFVLYLLFYWLVVGHTLIILLVQRFDQMPLPHIDLYQGLLAIATGFSVFMFQIFIMALCGIFSLWQVNSINAITLIGCLLFLFLKRNHLGASYNQTCCIAHNTKQGTSSDCTHYSSLKKIFYALPFIFAFIFYSHFALNPLIGNDEISAHLPYARVWLETGELTVVDHALYPLQVYGFNLIYAICMAFDLWINPELTQTWNYAVTVKAINIATLLLTSLMIWAWLRKAQFQIATAYLAALLPLFMSSIQNLSLSPLMDFPMFWMATTMCLVFCNWYTQPSTALLIVLGLLTAAHVDTKYFGIIAAGILLVGFISIRQYKAAMIYFIVATVIGGGWYLRNMIIAGNPFHPFLPDVFGYFLWDSSDYIEQFADLARYKMRIQSMTELLNILWNQGLWPIALALSTTALLWFKQDIKCRFIFAFVLFYTLVWLNLAHVVRYVLPIIFLSSLLLAINFEKILALVSKKYFNKIATISNVILVIVLSSYICNGLFHIAKNWHIQNVRDTISAMQQNVAGYSLMQKAATFHPKNNRLYQVLLWEAKLYYPGQAIGTSFGYANNRDIFYAGEHGFTLADNEHVKAILAQFATDTIVISHDIYVDRPQFSKDFNILWEDQYGMIAQQK